MVSGPTWIVKERDLAEILRRVHDRPDEPLPAEECLVVLEEASLADALNRATAGEEPELLMVELLANALRPEIPR